MVSLVVVGVVGVLVLNTKINENAFRLNDLHGQQAALDLQEQQLQQNLAELESPGNLRAAATPARAWCRPVRRPSSTCPTAGSSACRSPPPGCRGNASTAGR